MNESNLNAAPRNVNPMPMGAGAREDRIPQNPEAEIVGGRQYVQVKSGQNKLSREELSSMEKAEQIGQEKLSARASARASASADEPEKVPLKSALKKSVAPPQKNPAQEEEEYEYKEDYAEKEWLPSKIRLKEGEEISETRVFHSQDYNEKIFEPEDYSIHNIVNRIHTIARGEKASKDKIGVNAIGFISAEVLNKKVNEILNGTLDYTKAKGEFDLEFLTKLQEFKVGEMPERHLRYQEIVEKKAGLTMKNMINAYEEIVEEEPEFNAYLENFFKHVEENREAYSTSPAPAEEVILEGEVAPERAQETKREHHLVNVVKLINDVLKDEVAHKEGQRDHRGPAIIGRIASNVLDQKIDEILNSKLDPADAKKKFDIAFVARLREFLDGMTINNPQNPEDDSKVAKLKLTRETLSHSIEELKEIMESDSESDSDEELEDIDPINIKPDPNELQLKRYENYINDVFEDVGAHPEDYRNFPVASQEEEPQV